MCDPKRDDFRVAAAWQVYRAHMLKDEPVSTGALEAALELAMYALEEPVLTYEPGPRTDEMIAVAQDGVEVVR